MLQVEVEAKLRGRDLYLNVNTILLGKLVWKLTSLKAGRGTSLWRGDGDLVKSKA